MSDNAANEANPPQERFGLGTLVCAFAISALLAGSVGAGIGANVARNGGASVTASAGADPTTPTTAPAAGAPTAPGKTTTTSHNHTGLAQQDEAAESQPDVFLDDATRKQQADQLVRARDAALKLPTVKDAKAAGLILAGKNAPGVGAHYQVMNASALVNTKPDGSFDAEHPNSYIYDGTADDAPLAGIMYLGAGDKAPDGFAGPNDHWHRHSNVCIKYTNGQIEVPFRADSDVTKEQCDAVQGQLLITTTWMVHAWVVPGWESPLGVFSHANPNLHCRDGSDNVDNIGFCLAP